jgi:hypothetical protein
MSDSDCNLLEVEGSAPVLSYLSEGYQRFTESSVKAYDVASKEIGISPKSGDSQTGSALFVDVFDGFIIFIGVQLFD